MRPGMKKPTAAAIQSSVYENRMLIIMLLGCPEYHIDAGLNACRDLRSLGPWVRVLVRYAKEAY